MNAAKRRRAILAALAAGPGPVTGAELAEQLGVSRQVIVQDVAILRAGGAGVLATPRGYMLASTGLESLSCLVACRHLESEVRDELLIMVDLGAEVVDVIVEHPIYGQITGQLMLRTRQDVTEFTERLESSGAKLLSSLTGGVHLHTLRVPDAATLPRVRAALRRAGFLLSEE